MHLHGIGFGIIVLLFLIGVLAAARAR